MYFESVSKSSFETQKNKMRSYATSIASKAISSHMNKLSFNYKNTTNYQIGMYSKRLNLLYGEDIKGINFKEDIFIKDDLIYGVYEKNNALYVIDQSAHLHMGIKYIVLKDTTIFSKIDELKKSVITYTLLAIIFISIIGFFLSRLFLKPIANERERLDRFIKDTTHELNTPISALLMSTASLKTDNSKVLQRINVSAKRISNIYNDLCYLLKEDIKRSENITTIDIKDIIDEELTMLEGYSKSKKIIIKSELEKFKYNMDKESITRLINNIITNALKYSRPNSQIEISLKNNTLKVKDEGIGIKKSELKNIKNRYYRANKSEGGFGIGLDIVNLICKKYNIKFTIDSKEDIGTVVTLEF